MTGIKRKNEVDALTIVIHTMNLSHFPILIECILAEEVVKTEQICLPTENIFVLQASMGSMHNIISGLRRKGFDLQPKSNSKLIHKLVKTEAA